MFGRRAEFPPGDGHCTWCDKIDASVSFVSCDWFGSSYAGKEFSFVVRYMMSPLVATSTPSSIKLDWSDDEILMFLERKTSGEPLSSNIITEVNPFSFDPWNLPDNIWYLCNSKEPISPKAEGKIKNTTSGYWKDMECDVKICISNHTVGRKVTWEFFGGAAPSGEKIVWKMFEYKLEKSESQATEGQDFNSLCRIFWYNKNLPAFEEPQNSESLNDADGDYVQSALLSMLEQEEEFGLLGSTYGSQGLAAVSDGSVEDLRPNRSAECQADCDFSVGDFMELNDLYDPESSSSSSDNSSCVSESSDEYFDSEALLRVLESESKLVNEGHHAEHNFSVSSSLRSERMIVQPPPPSSIQNSGAHLVMMGEVSSSSGLARGPQMEGSSSFPPFSGSSGSPRRNRVTKETDSSSQGAGTSQGSVTNRVGRIAKLGKKYFCFASY
ncbi:hypothetical protein Taro_021412 [Colocasia esculenta]|uniref:NAC domain-containing protein n=1 Tax=Colocasia esculenta TaxID=4460 RepID=A0A843URC6_COLES|nr:hypothetical protein [Colocasia esculenta]